MCLALSAGRSYGEALGQIGSTGPAASDVVMGAGRSVWKYGRRAAVWIGRGPGRTATCGEEKREGPRVLLKRE